MADVVTPAQRRRMMAGIRGKDTRPELFLRQNLHRMGFRFRLHVRNLPGKPDIVFPRFNALIFAHGCFWHGHDCHLFKWPSTRQEFWYAKIMRNREVDARNEALLQEGGWRIAIVWECALKGRLRSPTEEILGDISHWLKSDKGMIEIRGRTERENV